MPVNTRGKSTVLSTNKAKIGNKPTVAATNSRVLRTQNSEIGLRPQQAPQKSSDHQKVAKVSATRRTRSGAKMSTTTTSASKDGLQSKCNTNADKENAAANSESPKRAKDETFELAAVSSGDTNVHGENADSKPKVAMEVEDNAGTDATDALKTCEVAPLVSPSYPVTDTRETACSTAALLNTSTSTDPNTSADMDTGGDIDTPNELDSSRESERAHNSTELLNTLFSNLYLNSVQRLCLQFPPRCAEDLIYCQQQHFKQRFNELDPPSASMLNLLEVVFQQQRYLSFITLAKDMCQRHEFPGERTFTILIELLLSINAKSDKSAFAHTYHKSIELFSYLVRVFPPCWRATRSAYIGFFQSPLDNKKISSNTTQKSTKIFDIVLDLVEDVLSECSSEELAAGGDNTIRGESKPLTLSESMEPGSEQFDHRQWEQQNSQLNTFMALKLSDRLDRLFVVLRLILQVLEHDFVMWLLHHYRKDKDWIFYTDSRPLAVFVYGISEDAHLGSVGRQLFLLFAVAANKGLRRDRLQVLERYVALLMVISNTADLEHSVLGVKYPQLGVNTRQLILDFFRKFKGRNLNTTIDSYINAIDVLRIPYVRYTFIDQFLQMFGGLQAENFSPEKVFHYMKKKRWLKLKPQAELSANTDTEEQDEISCEKYLALLLNALQAYCEWHACKDFMQLIMHKKSISSLKITTHSVHHTPIPYGLLKLNQMAKDITRLEEQLRKTVRVAKPQIDLPDMDMCIDKDLIMKYRSDLKYLHWLQQKVAEHSIMHIEVDFTGWKTFLQEYEVD